MAPLTSVLLAVMAASVLAALVVGQTLLLVPAGWALIVLVLRDMRRGLWLDGSRDR